MAYLVLVTLISHEKRCGTDFFRQRAKIGIYRSCIQWYVRHGFQERKSRSGVREINLGQWLHLHQTFVASTVVGSILFMSVGQNVLTCLDLLTKSWYVYGMNLLASLHVEVAIILSAMCVRADDISDLAAVNLKSFQIYFRHMSTEIVAIMAVYS